MINNSESIELKKNLKVYPLLDFYEQDIWDLTVHPLFSQLTEKQKKRVTVKGHILDFTELKSGIIANELKFFCQYCIEEEIWLLSYFVTRTLHVKLAIKFINDKLNEVDSLSEVGFEQATEAFFQYLKNNGYKTHSVFKSKLSKDMEYHEFKFQSLYLSFFNNLCEFIHKQYDQEDSGKNFFEKDIWDIHELPFKIQYSLSYPRYTISFKGIPQDKIRLLAKKYTFERLKSKKCVTCLCSLSGITLFSKFLNDNYPEIQSLAQLNRSIIEDYIGYINLNGNHGPRTQSVRIGNLKTFLDTCILFGWDEIPKQTLLISDDGKKKIKTLPKFYDEDTLTKLNENLDFVPIQIARMFFVLQNVGMRISELCLLKNDCIKQDTEKDYLIVYFQEKTQTWNRVPIKGDLALVIREAINYSKEQYGENVSYVFMQDNTRPISRDMFTYYMNRMVKKRDIRDSNGELVRIRPHYFRGTLATKYANIGMEPNLIRELLGQKNLGSVKYYIEILEETITEAMQDLLKYQDQMIQNIGNKAPVIQVVEEDKAEIPLPNGRCAKPLSTGKCTHANACYTCAVFKPDPSNLELFRYQLSEAKCNIEMAKINGYERVQQVNEDLASALEKIITSIEKGGGRND